MNYPIWNVPAAGLLIAGIAILHVFISHFAVGGGLFLVLLERRALLSSDEKLLGYVRIHSRFFILVTLVLGALTGVGIWFAIGLVQPQGTATLINFFVWVWAIEWIFFFTEIAAALVYYYGWDRLSPGLHLTVGWIYFVSAYLSLVAINGILTFMATPGLSIPKLNLFSAFFNPTYFSSLLLRTLAAMGLAGLYALLTASFLHDDKLKARIADYVTVRWLLPFCLLLPVGFIWYLWQAAQSGIPVFRILGAPDGGILPLLEAVFSLNRQSGYPPAQNGALVALLGSFLLLLVALFLAASRRYSFLRPCSALPMMLIGLLTFGGAEWVREDLRKPFVIGNHLFVNSTRLPVRLASRDLGRVAPLEDPFSIVAIESRGVLKTSLWEDPPEGYALEGDPAAIPPVVQSEVGRRVFHVLCSACHTENGYLAIRPLVAGRGPKAIEAVLDQLARPGAAVSGSWASAEISLSGWRDRRMPPFVGTPAEKRSLAFYLAAIGEDGGPTAGDEGASGAGQTFFEQKCSFCHGAVAAWPFSTIAKRRSAEDFYELLGRLPKVNPAMPPFDGTETDRKLVAEFLAGLVADKAPAEAPE